MQNYEKLIKAISSGKAILFTGAGFSRECKNIQSSNIMTAKELSEKICELGEFPKSPNLTYASERYLSNSGNASELVSFLKKNYTISEVPEYINKILAFKWKYIYTTNYDNSIELALSNNGIENVSVDMEQNIDDIDKNKVNCIHINGFIGTLQEENLDKTFKLTDSSYSRPEGFITSPWFTIFKRTIERCSAIVFIGYSMYDIDIKRLLVSISSLKERTFFITSEKNSEEEIFTLKQFGSVYECGVKKFSESLPDPSSIIYDEITLSCLKKYSPCNLEVDIKDKDVDDLMLYGKCNNDLIDNAVFSRRDSEYVVIRDKLDTILNLLEKTNIAILSELGNGKTIFLKELMPYLSKDYHVYYVEDYFEDIVQDVEVLAKNSDSTSVIIIDDYNKVINLFDSYPLYERQNLKFIISARSSVHEKYRCTLNDKGFNYKEIYIDTFTSEESKSLVKLLDSVGLWANLKFRNNRSRFFVEDCNSQISSLLISLLNSPDIKARIQGVLDKLLSDNKKLQDVAFVTFYLCMQNVRVDTSLISEIAGDIVYDANLRTNELFCEFFKFEHGILKSKSSVFCRSLIQNFFNPEYTIYSLLNIATFFEKRKKMSREHDSLFKSTLKFSTIERILPSEKKRENLEKYYESLKRKISWLINDPHFWVQYAMAKIAAPDYDKAQQYLDNAYRIARDKIYYETSNIDTQQARLFLLRAIKANFTLEAHTLFSSAHKILRSTPNDIYKCRQLYLYVDYYETKFNDLDINSKKSFIYACKEMFFNIKGFALGNTQYSEIIMKLNSISELKLE